MQVHQADQALDTSLYALQKSMQVQERLVEKVIEVPLVICGGAGSNEHFKEAISLSCVDAVAASNFFHHKDQSVYLLHEFLYNEGLNVRKPNFFKIK